MHKKKVQLKEKGQQKQDSASDLKALLTTIKNYHSKLSNDQSSLVSKRISLNPQVLKKMVSCSTDRKCSLPNIHIKNSVCRYKNKKPNEFEKHIILNYLNAQLKMSQSQPLHNKSIKKRNKKQFKQLPKCLEYTQNQSILQMQLQTIKKSDYNLDYKSIDSNKNYSLRQEPMKHYVQQKIERKKRQWKEKSPLQLQTYFILVKRTTENLNINAKKIQKQQKSPNIHVPSKQQLPTFIKSYIPKFKEINKLELIKKQNFNINLSKDSLFFGQIFQQLRHGIGIFIKNNYLFQGFWINDCKLRGLQITQLGSYTGTFHNDKKQGKGQFRWPNGQFYSGQWLAGKRHGVGLWTSPNGDSYIGEWKKGIVEGSGVHKTKAGQKYEGSFHNFLKHGWGKQYLTNGDRYEGQYLEGLPHGEGKYFWKNGVSYQGNFANGYRQGFGTVVSPKGFNYKGQFEKQKAMGQGEINYGNGQIYKGQIKNGKKNGKGILRNITDHTIFEGNWKQDEYIIT